MPAINKGIAAKIEKRIKIFLKNQKVVSFCNGLFIFAV